MTRRIAPLLAALAVVTLTAGCGGGDSDDRSSDTSSEPTAGTTAGASAGTSSSGSTDPSTEATVDGTPDATTGPTSAATGAAFAALDGQQIADTAKGAMLSLQSVRYRGNVASSDGTGTITIDLRADSAHDCTGRLGIQGGQVTLLSAGGQSWFKGDRKFWKAAAGSAGDQIFTGIDGRWVLDVDQDFSQFCQLDQFLGNLLTTSDGSTYAVQGASTVAGQDVVAVDRTAGDADNSSTGYVQTDAAHYLLRIERASGDQQGRLDFSEFDQPVTVQAPAADDVVDPSTLGSSAPSPSSGG